MAGTIKTPLNKRKLKKLGLIPDNKNTVLVICRGRRLKGDPYKDGHPLAGRVIQFLDNQRSVYHYAMLKDFPSFREGKSSCDIVLIPSQTGKHSNA